MTRRRRQLVRELEEVEEGEEEDERQEDPTAGFRRELRVQRTVEQLEKGERIRKKSESDKRKKKEKKAKSKVGEQRVVAKVEKGKVTEIKDFPTVFSLIPTPLSAVGLILLLPLASFPLDEHNKKS